MTDDIVERLKRVATHTPQGLATTTALLDAADEILRLRAVAAPSNEQLEAAGRAAEKEIDAADRGLRSCPVPEVYARIGRAAISAIRGNRHWRRYEGLSQEPCPDGRDDDQLRTSCG